MEVEEKQASESSESNFDPAMFNSTPAPKFTQEPAHQEEAVEEKKEETPKLELHEEEPSPRPVE